MIVWQESIIEKPKSLVEIAADAIQRGIICRELILGSSSLKPVWQKSLGFVRLQLVKTCLFRVHKVSGLPNLTVATEFSI